VWKQRREYFWDTGLEIVKAEQRNRVSGLDDGEPHPGKQELHTPLLLTNPLYR
jgi:hypothetical protein